MSTELRNVPNLNTTTELTQTNQQCKDLKTQRQAVASRLASELMSKLEFGNLKQYNLIWF
jgi:DNA repair ATPase RecN